MLSILNYNSKNTVLFSPTKLEIKLIHYLNNKTKPNQGTIVKRKKKKVSWTFLKCTIQGRKRQNTDWARIFAKHICGKRLVSRIYNKFSNSIIRNFKNGQIIGTGMSPKEIMQMANKQIRNCSASVDFREMQTTSN